MKLFQTFCKLMPFLVGYGVLEEYGFVAPNEIQKYLCSFTSLLGCVVLVSGTFLAGGFLAFEAETFDEIHEHFYEFATGLNYSFYFICMQWICKHLFDLNNNYKQMIRRRSIDDEKWQLYKKACKFVEISSKCFYFVYIKVVFPFITVPYLFMSYFNYYNTDLPPNEAFILPFVIWTIFDWRTPTTYIFAFTFEFIAAAYIILVAIVLLMHAFGSCWILIAFVDDIKTDLSALDAYKRNQISEVKLYEYFCEYIRLYKDIKQLLAKFGSTYALPFMLNLLLTASIMTVVIVNLQMELTRPETDLPAILKDISVTLSSIAVFVVICSACEELKGRFEDLNIYLQCKWYRYPIKMQHILTIIILDSQNSDVFRIFGSVTASRDTCKKVISGGFLTIVVLHTFLS